MFRSLLLAALTIVISTGGVGSAVAGDPGSEVVSRVVLSWKERQKEVRTLSFQTQIDSFYPKGSLSQVMRQEGGAKIGPEFPPKDQRFQNETASWVVDFTGKRVRKEFAVTNPFYINDNCDLFPDCQVHIFVAGNYRLFRPRDRNPWMATDNKRERPDVFLYEDQSHQFLFEFTDLPVFWYAGGVTGKQVFASDMKRLDGVDRFTYRGEAERGGRHHFVLTTQEQEASTIVREFWVDAHPPHLIRFCRAREGETVHWQLEASYREGELFPASWTHTQYQSPDYKAFTTRTFRVQSVSVNQPIPESSFDNTLQEGMVAFDVGRNGAYQVNRDGSLSPYNEESFRPNRWWRYGLGVTAAVLGLVLFVLLWRYRSSRSAEKP